MKTEITSTAAVRQFGDCLARIKYRGEVFVITRNEEPVAELVPVGGRRRARWREVREALAGLAVDPGFADDLERVNEADATGENPWDS